MTLIDFVNNNDVDYTFNRVAQNKLCEIEKETGFSFGEQTKKYILDYGYLGYKYVELFGINSTQGVKSDMVEKTLRLNNRFAKTKGLIAVEDQGDGDYYLVDSNDMIFRFVAANNELVKQDIDLFEYILQRFLTA